MAHPVATTFLQAARLLAEDDKREGNCLHFAAGEEVILAGDIHGHRANLAKIIRYADLPAHPHRRLVLQEIIHGGPSLGPAGQPAAESPSAGGADRSVELLLRSARLKLSHPDQVFFLMGNHDLAQFSGGEITKDGRGVCQAFEAGLEAIFAQDAAEVRSAVNEMLRSYPLAGRCENGVFLSHSLPSPGRLDVLDWEILRRPYREEDFLRGGSVYEWTWGRGHTEELLAEITSHFKASLFVLGHQHLETGYEIQLGRIVLVASDQSHGAVMVFDAGEEIRPAHVQQHIRPIVAL